MFKYDISIPISSYYKVIEVIGERLRDPRVIRISGYGHLGMIKYLLNVSTFLNLKLNNLEINSNSRRLQFKPIYFFIFFYLLGDGNIHVQVSIPSYEPDIASQLEPFIFEYVSKLRGSVSAEHGIGFVKTKYLHMSRTSSEIKLMHQLKKIMDPNGILNPYKVLYPLEIPA